MKRVVVINATLRDSVHEMIDSSLINCLSRIFESVAVFFREERSQCILRNVTATNVSFFPLNCSNNKGLTHQFFSAFLETWILLRRVNKDDVCFVTYINAFSGHLLNLVSKLTGKRVYICCHSELRVVAEPFVSIKKIWRYSLKKFFTKTKLAPKMKLIVLGECIRSNLSQYIDENRQKNFLSFDHPYMTSGNFKVRRLNDVPIRIGVIGYLTASHERGFDNVLKFAKTIENNSKLKLVIVSKISQNLAKQLPSSVEICSEKGDFLPREQYDAYVNDLDYIYSPYPKDSFKFTASGALLEAISRNKPILFHGNDYALYLEKKFGKFGICLDELSPQIINSLLVDCKEYDVLVDAQKKFQKSISPEELCYNLKELFLL